MTKAKCCKVCGAHCDLYLCKVCAAELRDLLIGSSDERGQPGIAWYIGRLKEQTYGQSRLGSTVSAKSSREGYALLVDKRAADLLRRITGTLSGWLGDLRGLRATQSDENPAVGVGLAQWLAGYVRELRRHPDSYRLHADLLAYARESWVVINRPPDNCCGPCPTMIHRAEPNSAYAQSRDNVSACSTLLYAEEHAKTVRCPRCRCSHDVETLRKALRDIVVDMLFTGPELLRLMETRLNDRMPKQTFYKLVKDGRLQARCVADDGVRLFTYNDVCNARDKLIQRESRCATTKDSA